MMRKQNIVQRVTYIRIKFIEFESEWTQLAIVHKNNDK